MPNKFKIIISEPEDWCLTSIQDQHVPEDWSLSVSHVSDFREYNKAFLSEPRATIYGFLTGKDKLSDGCIGHIIKAFTNPEVGLVYSDKYLEKNGNLIPQLYPYYEAGNNHVIFNPTVFVSGAVKSPIFDPNLKYLGSYDVINKLGRYCRIIHIPKFLIVSKFAYANIDEDLKRVWQQNS